VESLPAQRLGFRRILAAIYIHTGSHIVGAAMARYLAIFGSKISIFTRLCVFASACTRGNIERNQNHDANAKFGWQTSRVSQCIQLPIPTDGDGRNVFVRILL
jgi:hypothetical protein